MRGEIADQDVRQRLVIVLVLRGAHRWRLRGLQVGARAVPALAGKPRLEKSLVVHGGDDVDGWFRYGELRASSARDAGDSLKIKFPFLRKNPRKNPKKNPRKALQGEISPARPVSGGSSKFHGESRRAASHLPGPPTLLPALARQFDRRLWNSNRSKEPGGYYPMPMQGGVWWRQPGDLGGLGCAPTNRPLVACAGCPIDGFRVDGGLETSADWALANDCRRPSTAPVRP